jgi:hypothetical protein
MSLTREHPYDRPGSKCILYQLRVGLRNCAPDDWLVTSFIRRALAREVQWEVRNPADRTFELLMNEVSESSQ